MFRLTTTFGRMIPAIVLTTVVAGAASAQSVDTERYYDEENDKWVLNRTIENADGGSLVVERNCANGDAYENLSGCVSSKTLTAVDGQTASTGRLTIRGPERTSSFRRSIGVDGDVSFRHRRWRN